MQKFLKYDFAEWQFFPIFACKMVIYENCIQVISFCPRVADGSWWMGTK